MKSVAWWCAAAVVATGAAFVSAVATAEDAPSVPEATIHLVPLKEGLKSASPGQDLGKLGDADIQKIAMGAGVDLREVSAPYLIHSHMRGTTFVLFYKSVGGPAGDRPWAIQRIKRTERNWGSLDSEPEVKITWQVEAFKTRFGELKRPDQHHSRYGIQHYAKREIVKEYEIGWGEVPHHATGTAWPFDRGKLFHKLQPYQAEVGLHDNVHFTRSVTWTLRVTLDENGDSVVAAPKLGIESPARKVLDTEAARPWRDPRGKDLVLVPGAGMGKVALRTSTRAEVEAALGTPCHLTRASTGSRNLVYARGFEVNIDPAGISKTIITHPSFGGRTDKGIRLGATRDEVVTAHGAPARERKGSQLSYPGIHFFLDSLGRVTRMVVTASAR